MPLYAIAVTQNYLCVAIWSPFYNDFERLRNDSGAYLVLPSLLVAAADSRLPFGIERLATRRVMFL